MVSITLAVTEELKSEMDHFKEINWSEVARAAIKSRVESMKKFQEFTRDSEFTEKDAIALGKKVNKAAAAKYLKLRK